MTDVGEIQAMSEIRARSTPSIWIRRLGAASSTPPWPSNRIRPARSWSPRAPRTTATYLVASRETRNARTCWPLTPGTRRVWNSPSAR